MRRDGRGFEDWRVWRPRGGAGWMSFICTADSQSPDTGTGTGQSGPAAWKFSGKLRHNRSGLQRNVFNHLMSENVFWHSPARPRGARCIRLLVSGWLPNIA